MIWVQVSKSQREDKSPGAKGADKQASDGEGCIHTAELLPQQPQQLKALCLDCQTHKTSMPINCTRKLIK